MGHQVAAVIAYALNTHGGSAPTITSAASTVSELLNQEGDNFALAGGATFTLLPVSGQAPGTVLATVTNNGASADTISAGTNYNGGALNTFADGSTTSYSLAAGATKTFYVVPVTDTTGVSYVLVR